MNLISRFPLILLSVGIILLSACATGSLLPKSPTISVRSIKLGKFNLQEQEFIFNLAVENSNRFAIPVLSTDFYVSLAGNEVAKGNHSERISLVAQGVTTVPIRVNAQLYQSIGQLLAGLANGKLDLDYRLEGSFKVGAGRFPVDIPFLAEGSVLSQFED